MRAIGYQQPGPISDPASLCDIDLPRPSPTGRDLLVRVRAVSVNPVDTKIRSSAAPEAGGWKVLGWDAAGTVVEAGLQTTRFKTGDEVYYAGAIGRPGTNAEYHLVDERIVGRKPASLDFSEAAALPLTAITAWEALFDRLEVRRPVAGAAPVLLVIGGAGGVGSMAIQLARVLTGLTVIATASRPETVQWVEALGAHHVINHREPLAPQVEALGLGAPSVVFSTTNTNDHVGDIAELIAPQGRFALIDDPKSLDIVPFKRKSVSIHWELMFTRSIYDTQDIEQQGILLGEVARLVDQARLRSTMTQQFGTINAANLKRAHALLESGRSIGKIVLSGFE
ncbi:zinc-binding alcohol dehydrogenase family protein [Lichenicoccus roseus]|uniref:Zinc-type alcohol dehydrogenase-like protein n=1 Tax=Lichenicoccus roseus TaxID=2683649 RepID=A0A5R9J717_9PROT|nr:zinc-binding alcohol dehydrogenase family protein [Lichenicoccus roseus]TLU73414.1 zinc-binding alcohol dehydrogenase family protein [Lichenicoccus roseus]